MFKVQLEMRDFETAEQKLKLMEAKNLMEKVFNSKEFKERVLGHCYKITYYKGFWPFRKISKLTWTRGFRLSNGMDSEALYDFIMKGAEALKPDEDNTANIDVTLYVSRKSVVGYTYPHTMRQWINAKFFNQFGPHQVAGNLSHEWMHKLGFEHEFNNTPTRKFTVPYAIGYIVEELALKYMNNPDTWEYVNG